MAEQNKVSFIAIKDYVGKQYQGLTQGLTQGVKDLIQTASDVLQRKSKPLEDKFPCPIHPNQFIQSFTTSPSDKMPYIFCQECLMESSATDKSAPKSSTKIFPIGNLFGHFTEAYDQLRYSYELKNINKITLENFLDKITDMQAQMTHNIEEEKQKFAIQAQKAIELFTSQINSIKDHMFTMLSSELNTFSFNLNHVQNQINIFLNSLKTFEEMPKVEDLTQKINKLRTSEDIVGFIKENEISVNIISLQLDSFNHKSYEHYKYALYLMRKTYQYLHNPPHNPASGFFTFNSQEHTPSQFLKQLEENITNLDLPSKLKLDNTIEDLAALYSLDSFSENPMKIEPFKIDSLDFFYPSTAKTIQCLHYYDQDKKYLVMINLGELSESLSNKDLSSHNIIYKIPIPKEVTLPRMVKTISLPDGSIYFIGGETTSETLLFEYKEAEIFKKPQNKKNAEENKEQKKISNPKRNEAPVRNDMIRAEEFHITKHGIFLTKAKMNRHKYGHGLVYIGNGSIYSIAGFDISVPNGYTNKCERFIIKENRWVDVRSCIYAVNHPGVCTFDNKYIYKFGGFVNDEGKTVNKIERYHIERDIWTEIQIAPFSGNVHLYPKSIPLQINEQEIMILGGYTKEFLFSDDCAFLRVNKIEEGKMSTIKLSDENLDFMRQSSSIEEEIEKPKELMLPLDNRLVYQSLIYDGKLYCLTVRSSFHEVVKNVMVFNGKKWSIVL